METFKAWRELIRAVRDIAIAIGGGNNKSSDNTDNIKFWKEKYSPDDTTMMCQYVIKVDSFFKNENFNTDTEEELIIIPGQK